MSDERRRILLIRAEEARRDYGLALAQIVDDASAAGIAASEIVADLALCAWAKDAAKKATIGEIYFAKVEGLDIVKVGFSLSVADRMRALRNEHQRNFEVLGTLKGTMADERWLHRLLWWCRDKRLKGNEFFNYSASRGLLRIFLGVSDRFEFTEENKTQTWDWVGRIREAAAKDQPTTSAALAAIGATFEKLAIKAGGADA